MSILNAAIKEHNFRQTIDIIEQVLDGHQDDKLQAVYEAFQQVASYDFIAYDKLEGVLIINPGRLLTETPYSYTTDEHGELRFKILVDFFPLFTIEIPGHSQPLCAIRSEVDGDRMKKYLFSFLEHMCDSETLRRARMVDAGYHIF